MISLLSTRKPKLFIVDDEPANIALLKRVLVGTQIDSISSTSDPTKAVEMFLSIRPNLLLLDLQMPVMDGFAVLAALKAAVGTEQFPLVLVITGDNSATTRNRALSGGAKDFIAKPFDADEVRLRVTNLLETHQLQEMLRRQNAGLAASFYNQTLELEESRIETVERLALVGGLRDDVTGKHNERVARMAGAVAAEIGTPESAALLGRVAALHDIGKVGIPDSILLKAGPLTADEWVTMKTHTTIGAQILSSGRSEFMLLAEKVAGCHHERWDGKGYPKGLRGTQIPLAARIVAIVDVFDALGSDRPYRPAFSVIESYNEIERGSGTHFDPSLVKVFRSGVGLTSLRNRSGSPGATRVDHIPLQRFA